MNKDEIIETLQNKRQDIVRELKKIIIEHKFNYKTFGVEIEDYLFNIVTKILRDDMPVDNNLYRRAKDKNEFPDLTIYVSPKLALEAKSGNRSKLVSGTWKKCNNSANDLGTINSWDKKILDFGGDNIYFIFIEYNFTDKIEEIIDVKIEPFYKFIGLNSDNLLSYREKDGNLRPKNFDEKSPVNSLNEFLNLLPATRAYRSGRVAYKHLKVLSMVDIEKVLRKLFGSKNKFKDYL